MFLVCGCAAQAIPESEIPEIPEEIETPVLPPVSSSESLQSPEVPESQAQEPFSILLSQEDEEAHTRALQDIELYRKGDIIITVSNEEGEPLHLKVEYHQVEHSFLFGIFNPESISGQSWLYFFQS